MKVIEYLSEIDFELPESLMEELENEIIDKIAEQGYDPEDAIEWKYDVSIRVKVKVPDAPKEEQ